MAQNEPTRRSWVVRSGVWHRHPGVRKPAELTLGESVAVDGACLTVIEAKDDAFAVDASAERERLELRLKELEGSIGALEKRLSNPGYTDKAPAHLVAETRGKLEQQITERDAVTKRLGELG